MPTFLRIFTVTMKKFSDYVFLLGFPAALDLAFEIPETKSLEIYVKDPRNLPSRQAMLSILPSLAPDAKLRFKTKAPASGGLTTDGLYLTPDGSIIDLNDSFQLRQTKEIQHLALNFVEPTISDTMALARAGIIITRYPTLSIPYRTKTLIRSTRAQFMNDCTQKIELLLAEAYYEDLEPCSPKINSW